VGGGFLVVIEGRISLGRTVARVGPIAVLALGACAFHETGLVHAGAASTMLETPEGKSYRLILVGEAAPVAFLDGHLADIRGTRTFHTVAVRDWKVAEGLHGMAAWVGVLEQTGVQIGLLDRNSGAYYVVDRDGADVLYRYVGEPVLLEGYVEGAHQVHVLYFRVLAPG
jgi:hypothetical protein